MIGPLFAQACSHVVSTSESSRAPAQVLLAYLMLALSMALVGSYVALSKPLAVAFPVFLLAWLRFWIGGVTMLPWLRRPVGEAPISRETHRLLFLESLFGNFLFTLCMLYGMRLTSAVSAGVILASIPAVVALMGWLLLGERITRRVWAGIACAGVGIGLLALSKSEQSIQSLKGLEPNSIEKSALWGNLLIFGAVVCEALYAVIGKKLTDKLSPRRISALINLWGLLLTTPLGLYWALQFDFHAITPGLWGLLGFYSIAASVGTVWLWMSGLRTVPAARAGVFTVMLPITAALVGVVAMGERLSGIQILAFAIALAGVVLATLPSGVTVSGENR